MQAGPNLSCMRMLYGTFHVILSFREYTGKRALYLVHTVETYISLLTILLQTVASTHIAQVI